MVSSHQTPSTIGPTIVERAAQLDSYLSRLDTSQLLAEMEQRLDEVASLTERYPSVKADLAGARLQWAGWNEEQQQVWVRCCLLTGEAGAIATAIERRMSASRN